MEIIDPDVARHMEEVFTTDYTQATEISLAQWQRRSRLLRFSDWILSPLRLLL